MINVAAANDIPLAAADAAATNENTTVTTTDVLVNDSLGDQPTTIVAFDAVSAQGGTVVLGASNTFTYTPAAGFSGIDTFTYTIRDSDGETSTATVTVTVANVANDAPVNIVPGAQISAEDATLVFSLGTGNLIAVSDPDAGANPLEVTLAAIQGTLTLAGTAGLTFTAGDGTADATMTFTGTQAAINAALDGMSFLPPLDYSGPASVTITTGDLGSTGAGGPQSDTRHREHHGGGRRRLAGARPRRQQQLRRARRQLRAHVHRGRRLGPHRRRRRDVLPTTTARTSPRSRSRSPTSSTAWTRS